MSTDTESLRVLAERVAQRGYEMDSDRRADTAATLRQAADDLEALKAENARLRGAVEAAPHDNLCRTYHEFGCTCWKADAIKIGQSGA